MDKYSLYHSRQVLSGSFSARPEAGTVASGSLYLPTDGYYPAISNGSTWGIYAVPGFKATNPPAPASFTNLNFGSYISLQQDGDGLLFTFLGDGNGTNYAAASVVEIPASTPYSLVIGVEILSWYYATNAGFIGLCITNGVESNSQLFTYYFFLNGHNSWALYGQKWTLPTTWVSTPINPGTTVAPPFSMSGRFFMKLTDDGVNLLFYVSKDGKTWDAFPAALSVGRTSYVTPSYIGLFTGHGNASVLTTLTRMRAKIFHWSLG
jgi:hypothetical protein